MSWDEQRRQAGRVLREEQRRDDDRRRHDEQRVLAEERQGREEQHRLRHLAEDEERRRRKVLDLSLGRVRTATYRARIDAHREPDLVRARAEAEEAERQWKQADDERRRWPSAWPW